MRYLRFAEAKANPYYMDLIDECAERLTRIGSFSFVEVLSATKLSVFAPDVRFDYVRRAIEEDYNTRLTPLAETYFKRHTLEEERVAPGRFLALGNGKGTAGYALASVANGHLVLHHLKTKAARHDGHAKAITNIAGTVTRAGIISPTAALIEPPNHD